MEFRRTFSGAPWEKQVGFGEHPPATSMVEVKSLIDPAMLIEIEVDAVIADDWR